ncbi:RagB/SusD family nutrient uptake outer membrane protein [Solitalea lacus]|uniref:RagB/SusD family nutrient uptake outer membrane protein n=1 Tax=Solitalea lacus TaxID=2911172 RepID=UPI001EDC0E7F|nr:RagB/SusD family nutrient uptake outer membrane protein [Solitalea lacus]UKJ07376.1 RagB/SusD family nutrient uptake outer membrane protein [Solitalea lacus]
MNLYKIIKYGTLSILACFIMLSFKGCKLESEIDPNNPSLEGVLQGATIPELNNIVIGTEAGMRDELQYYLDDVGAVGREMYRFSGSDPRYTADLLGKGNTPLDNNAFYTTRPWNSFYRVVKNCNILLQSVENTGAPTDQQKQAYRGYANTLKAYSLLLALNLCNDNGIRIDVADIENLGPIVSKTDALTAIANLLNDGFTQMNAVGTTLPFSSTLATNPQNPFAPPSTNAQNFARFNRALAARVAVYRGLYTDALNYLNQSFFNLNGDFLAGVYHVYSTASGDLLNLFFTAPNSTGEVRPAHPSFLSDAQAAGEGNDGRLSKILLRTSPVSSDGLTATHDVAVYKNNTSPIPIIRNEELILIYIEANIQTNAFPNAILALNRIRTSYNLLPYAGAVTQGALLTEMLKQRRYSLFIEGHRWVDMRRYNRLGELPLDRTGDNVWNCFPIPFPENEPSPCQ